MKTLIIEDDSVSRLVLSRAVTERGHEVQACKSAEQGIDACDHALFPLILLDLHLPGMDGLDFCQWVRSQPWGDHCFILVATARNQAEDLQAVLAAGADDYIAKPYDLGFLRVRLTIAERQVKAIAERKQAENTLRQSEARFSSFMSHLPGLAFLKEPNGRFVYFNETFAHTFHLKLDQCRGRFDSEFLPESIAGQFRKNDAQVLESKQAIQTIEQVPQGELLHSWFVNKFPIFKENGDVDMIAGLAVDITQRRQFEEMNKIILRTAMDGFWLTDLQGAILEVNDAYCRMSDYSREELLQKRMHDLDATRSGEEISQLLLNLVQSGSDRFETRHRTREGSLVEVEASVNCLEIGGQKRFTCFFRDITERKKLAEERLRTTKLESIGLLAGGIAHDFNNALTAIIGNVMLAQNDLAADHSASPRLLSAQAAAARATGLARQLLTFAKGGEPIKKMVRLSELLPEVAQVNLKGSSTQLVLEIAPDLWQAEADAGQVTQVIRNLVLNAREAMNQSGSLCIEAANVSLEQSERFQLPSGRYIRLVFSDEGPGIAEEILPKIFDPYFSTKKSGAGLGLAICYSIVKKHGGLILAESLPGRGASFQLYLPAKDAPLPPPKAPLFQPTASSQTSILVMDDDPAIREVTSIILSHNGYEVTLSNDGEEALRLYEQARQAGKPFDLVLMDLTIPDGMGGKDAVAALRQLDPRARAIVFSGYSDDPVMANYQDYGFRARLHKPFTGAELLAVLSEVLARPAS